MEITIREANSTIQYLENQIILLNEKKQLEFEKTQPHTSDTQKVSIEGGLKRDKFLEYVISIEDLEIMIKEKESEKKIYIEFVNSELKRLGEYGELEQLIYTLREMGNKWRDISEKTNYCESQCRNIFRKIKNGKMYNAKK